ncbi:cell division protein FtsZ [Methanolobus psychrotolerans]|uniref:cell division protein FtsZ n=1 Tax=Methanolobus psychrotolerans TaxID=1874706 RepID=UPI000B91C657|nr:cell division protein FtsZ [Methanolobus psychrotolerans]
MQSIVQEALKHTEKEKEYRQSITVNDQFDILGQPRIMIVGCGGAGNNTINRLYNMGIEGAETVAINTDKQHLDLIRADKKILVGKTLTRGLGAGGYPEIGAKAAELARGTLEEIFKNADLVFVTAGMGGGTGTGVAPVVAEIAKEQGAIVVGMVSSPFRVERARAVKAEEGLEEFRRAADTVIVLDNNRLLEYVPNLPIDQAFSVMDQIIAETVKGITETITQPSLINIDYADIRAIMGCGGVAVMLVGESKNQDKSNDVVRAALNHPLLDVDYRGATGSLVHITGGPDLSLKEAEEIAASLTYELSPSANVIWGARISKEFEGKVRVMAIMTGVQSAQVLGPQYNSINAYNSAPVSSSVPCASSNTPRAYRHSSTPATRVSRPVIEPMPARSHGGSIIDIIH